MTRIEGPLALVSLAAIIGGANYETINAPYGYLALTLGIIGLVVSGALAYSHNKQDH